MSLHQQKCRLVFACVFISSSLCSGREAGLVPAVGGGAHRGVRRAAGEEQLQEADEGVRAELVHHGPQHELPALPGGLGVDGAGQSALPPTPHPHHPHLRAVSL